MSFMGSALHRYPPDDFPISDVDIEPEPVNQYLP
jgi:hypothetical protein